MNQFGPPPPPPARRRPNNNRNNNRNNRQFNNNNNNNRRPATRRPARPGIHPHTSYQFHIIINTTDIRSSILPF